MTTNWNQKLSENLSFKLLSDIVFQSFPGQSVIPCFTMVNLQLVEYPWQPNFSNDTRVKLKNSIYIWRSIAKPQLKVVLWLYFSMVARPIHHTLFYNGQFPIIPLADKLTKSQQSKTKKMLLNLKNFKKTLVSSGCLTSFFGYFLANLMLLLSRWLTFN